MISTPEFRDCHSWAKKRIYGKRQQQLKLLERSEPLDLVIMDILSPHSKPKKGRKLVVLITSRSTKITNAIPISSRTATTITRILLEQSVSNYSITSKVLTEDGSKIYLKRFNSFCSNLVGNNLTITKYHSRISGHAERFEV